MMWGAYKNYQLPKPYLEPMQGFVAGQLAAGFFFSSLGVALTILIIQRFAERKPPAPLAGDYPRRMKPSDGS